MSNKYILAIDGGSQSTKVAIFDLRGTQVCFHSEKLKALHLYGNSRAEHPDDDLWDTLRQACRELLGKFPADKGEIIGVGLGSIRCCRALLKADGSLVSPVQNWMDLRLSKPYQHEDDSVRYVTTATGYLTHRMTGQTRDTRSNYVGPWPIDPDTLDWYEDADKFAEWETPREMLFELVDPATELGTVSEDASRQTGIPAGIPVVATANDKAVEGLGAGLRDDGTVLVSLGTYVTSMMVGRENRTDAQQYWCNPGATPGEFLYESNGIRYGMSTVTWIKDLLGGDILREAKARGMSPEQYLSHLASDVTPGCDGLYTVLHWLARPTHPFERGMMIGFNGTHKGPHMFRSVLEGIAMSMYNNASAMCDERGVALSSLVVSGGGSNGDLFMQIFADVFGVPARRNMVNNSASMGAAICAALALGVYPDRDRAIAQMVTTRDTFYPDTDNVTLYRKINQNVYRNLPEMAEDALRISHGIFNPEN